MRIWKHVWPTGGEADLEGRRDELDIEVQVGNNATVRLPAVQRLRLLYKDFGKWRQGSSVYDTVYDTSRDDPDIHGSGTLIGMFKSSNDAWNAVECHNAVPLLVQALVALLDANAAPAKDPPPPRCTVCCKEITPEEVGRVNRAAAHAFLASVADYVGDCCERCFVTFLGNDPIGKF